MKCRICESCGTIIDGVWACTLVLGEEESPQQYCWCLCEGCRTEFVRRTGQVVLPFRELPAT